eukprot:g28544.t1
MAREKLNRVDDALKDTEEALRLQPNAEESREEEEEVVAEAKPNEAAIEAPAEPFADIELEHTVAGAEKAKDMGNKLFQEGKIQECERWFSKAIWLVEESGKVSAPDTLRGILHSNRAFARLRMQRWSSAELDCDEEGGLREVLGDLYEARQTISKKRRLLQRDHNHTSSLWQSLACEVASPGGPWRLKVDLEAPKEAPPAFRKHHRVVLVFPTSWPQSLPSIRFTGQLRSFGDYSRKHQLVDAAQVNGLNPKPVLLSLYVKPPDEDKSDHVHEASSKLLARLQEAVGPITCMWRQTGGCNATGDREPEKDRLCGENVPLGNSGFCDCNGDGLMNGAEPGYSCESSPGSCETRCPQEVQKATQDLHGLLSQLHRSLGGALHPSDQTAWQRTASTFEEDARFQKATAIEFRSCCAQLARIFKLIFKVFNGTRYSRAEAKKQLLASGLIKEIIPDLVFSFPVFTLEFCTLLMEEIRNFYGSKLPARRPNSMNNYGIILNEIGLEPMIFDLQDALIQPLASVLFPLEGSELESHHSFTIRYKGGEDTHLDVHTDDSDVTFNVNIFGNYTGAPLVFCGINGEPDHRHFRTAYQHQTLSSGTDGRLWPAAEV